ncbi:MAG: aspartyl protease family protein [Acidobacteriota bacterium]
MPAFVRTLLAAAALAATLPFPAQAPAAAPPCEALAGQERWREALACADAALALSPGDPALLSVRVRALMGLFRFKEAADVAFPLRSRRPDMAFASAACLFKMGRYMEAFQVWSSLRADPEFAGPAYERLVSSLDGAGRREEARVLALEALERLPAPPSGLVFLAASLEDDPALSLGLMERFGRGSLSVAGGTVPPPAVLRAARGPLCEAKVDGPLPSTVPLETRSDPVDLYGIATPGARQPKGPAPSAQAYDHALYNPMPPELMAFSGAGLPQEAAVRRLVVSARLEGKGPYTLALDSSSSVLLLSSGTAKALALKPLEEGAISAVGLEGTLRGRWTLVDRLEVGPLSLRRVPAFVLSGPDAAGVAAGVLPLWLLRRWGLAVDVSRGSLVFHPPGTPPEVALGTRAVRIPALWTGEGLRAAFGAPDGRNLNVLFDVGSPFSSLHLGRLDVLGLARRRGMERDRVEAGKFGVRSYAVLEDLPLTAGSIQLRLSAPRAVDLGDGPEAPAGVLGRDALGLFVLYLDWTSGTAALGPASP